MALRRPKGLAVIGVLVVLVATSRWAVAQEGQSAMSSDNNPLFVIPEGVETRWASPENPKGAKGQAAASNHGRKGRPAFGIKAGEQVVLAEEPSASGTIRRIWVTIDDRSPQMLRGLRLDFYWDGATKPAASAPLGDFFGTGLGKVAPFQSALFSSPEGRSFVCFVPMPFRKGMKVLVANESGKNLGSFFYDIDYTIGDRHGPEVLYFHTHWRRENPTTMRRDFDILPKVAGRGRFLGCNIGVIADQKTYFKSWWGEGEVKVYLDGDRDLPTLSGTGTEDYIGTGWGQGRYDHPYQGCHVADGEKMQYCFYRYHVLDPIYFRTDVRVTIQQIGCWDPTSKAQLFHKGEAIYATGQPDKPVDFSPAGGTSPYGIYERQDDWSSCCYFYLGQPSNDLPALPPVAQRTAGL